MQDYAGGFDEDGEANTPILPIATELNQARLCDDMPALAPVQIGPTGRSVSRSYGATLSKLVPSCEYLYPFPIFAFICSTINS